MILSSSMSCLRGNAQIPVNVPEVEDEKKLVEC
jgi:hypothetical protein